MVDDWVGPGVWIALGLLQRAALTAFLRVDGGVLVSDLALRQALQADAETRGVHHDEHSGEALLGLADQPALRAVIVHHTGSVAVDAHLLLERSAAEAVALARCSRRR